MLRHGYVEPRTAVGRAERDKRVRELLRAIGERELLASEIATSLGWSDWMTGAVLDAGLALGHVTRRQERDAERRDRHLASGTKRRTCWLYRASGTGTPAERATKRQPPRMIFRALPKG